MLGLISCITYRREHASRLHADEHAAASVACMREHATTCMRVPPPMRTRMDNNHADIRGRVTYKSGDCSVDAVHANICQVEAVGGWWVQRFGRVFVQLVLA